MIEQFFAAAEGLALLAMGLFAGGAAMQTVVDHPARIAASDRSGLEQMQQVLRRADPYMPILAVLGSAGALATGLGVDNRPMLAAAALLILVVPLTLVAISLLNRRMLEMNQVDAGRASADLLRRWGRLHLVRTLLGLSAFLLAMLALLAVQP